jgi:hypothetical protein
MARPTHDALALAALTGLSLLGIIATSSIPARAARFTPTPHAEIAAHRPVRRPPTPRSNEATAGATQDLQATITQESATVTAPSAGASRSSETSFEGIGISGGEATFVEFSSDESDWLHTPGGYAWQRHMFYLRREWRARWSRYVAERRSRVRTWLEPGSANDPAMMAAQSDDHFAACSVFAAACAGGGRRSSTTAALPTLEPTEVTPAEVRHRGDTWTLANGASEMVIDVANLCAIQLRRTSEGEALPPLAFDTPGETTCAVSETAPPDAARGGVAVAITWRGGGWWQQAIVSLGDGSASPEANLTRVETTPEGRKTTSLTNFTAAPLTWTLDGREVRVPSGAMASQTR